jgi:hypothetical protein
MLLTDLTAQPSTHLTLSILTLLPRLAPTKVHCNVVSISLYVLEPRQLTSGY